jgi:acyl-CoA thioesterase FadM
MARVKIHLPEKLPFLTEIAVRITDINYGGHLGNDSLLGLLHEARARFFAAHGWKESDVEGVGIIMTDAAIVYKAEVFYGETLRFEVGVGDLQRVGCDIVYRVVKLPSQALVAEAKTGIVFFDYKTRKVQKTPQSFAEKFSQRGQ